MRVSSVVLLLCLALLAMCALLPSRFAAAASAAATRAAAPPSPMQSSESATSAAMQRWQRYHYNPQLADSSHRHNVPLAAQVETNADGATLWSVTRPEGSRTFWVRLPAQYNTSVNVSFPVLFALHGLGDTCDNFGPSTGFSALADNSSRPFIFVYPCGWPGLIGNGWNAGTCCLQPTTIDDVAFARAIVSALVDGGVRVDSSRMWVSGFSNGAMMAEVICCSAADVFSASASVSGVVELQPGNDGGLALCDKQFAPFRAANRSLAVYHVHGLADDVVPFTGDALLGFPPILQDLGRWVERVGCSLASNTSTLSSGPYSNVVWSNCTAQHTTTPHSLSVQLVEVVGGGHAWPVDKQFDTTRAIVDFFFQSAESSAAS